MVLDNGTALSDVALPRSAGTIFRTRAARPCRHKVVGARVKH